ncbi:MAG: hypothetical protein JO121_08495 [Deltaproteobacteria bacterium]|jgi:hypothetical protein|nr:hypothetical protein [Deltaproteobacteria bacterium]
MPKVGLPPENAPEGILGSSTGILNTLASESSRDVEATDLRKPARVSNPSSKHQQFIR